MLSTNYSIALVICLGLVLQVTPQQQQQQQVQFQTINIPNRLLPFFRQPEIEFIQRLQRQFFQQQQNQQQQQQFSQQQRPTQNFEPQQQQQNFVPQQQQQNFEQPSQANQNFQTSEQQFQTAAQQQFVQVQPRPVQIIPQQPQQQFFPAQPVTIEQQRPTREEPMTEVCLACLCQASSSCNLSTQCVAEGKYCGPFLLSQPYWLDAGSPTLVGDSPTRPGAFEDCSTDPVCSAQAVRTYMTKYRKDCNGDGKIDCDDLGRIHLLGASGCVNPTATSSPFYQRFLGCFTKANQLSNK